MLSADTNLFLYAANAASPHCARASQFFEICADNEEFVVCELVLVEIYMQLRNPSVLKRPLDGAAAAGFCEYLRANPQWQHVDYEPLVSAQLWRWARAARGPFRHIIDARIALTLRHHGVTRFATANVRDFDGFGFDEVWDPLAA